MVQIDSLRARKNRRCEMRKVLSAVLVLSLMVTALMIISCAEEEKSPKKVEEVATEDVTSKAPKTQTTDAFSGNPIKRNIYADYQGKRIYFCCANSKRQFEGDPERYIAKFRELGVTLEDAPAGR
jgi:YHS domain-containing protein